MALYKNILAPSDLNLHVKVDCPMGSVKDRMAKTMITQPEQSGELESGQNLVEATSGTTGIGLAMACVQKGYPLMVNMAEKLQSATDFLFF